MKRAERAIIRSRALEREIGTDHFHNVVRGGDLFDDVGWDRAHDFSREEGGTLAD